MIEKSKKRYSFYGDVLGILMLDVKAQLFPGNVGNANSYDFPVRFKVLDGIPTDFWCDERGADEKRFEIFLKKAKELEAEGVKAITTGCGFFTVYQKRVAEQLSIPLFASPLLLVPVVSRMIGKNKKVGIIAAGGKHLTQGDFLENAGIDSSIPIAVGGLENSEEFYDGYVTLKKKDIDIKKLEKEVVNVAQELLKKNKDIGAFVFECSDIPTFAKATSEATGLPVFDFISFAHLVYWALIPRCYSGFM
jgi:aspartate/glutamate racemase